jgi:hypothetical protein
MRQPTKPLLVVATLVIAAVAATASPTQASTFNCTAYGTASGFDGYNHYGGGIIGVSADLVVRSASMCGSDTSSSNAFAGWTMIWDSGGYGYLQSGYLRTAADSAMYHFSQYQNNAFTPTEPFTVVIGGVSLGSSHRYWQQYAPDGTYEFHSNVDTTRMISLIPGMLSYGWTAANQSAGGEVTYRATDMPGSSANPATFSNIAYQSIYSPYPFTQYPCGSFAIQNNRPTAWSIGPVGCSLGPNFKIWT